MPLPRVVQAQKPLGVWALEQTYGAADMIKYYSQTRVSAGVLAIRILPITASSDDLGHTCSLGIAGVCYNAPVRSHALDVIFPVDIFTCVALILAW